MDPDEPTEQRADECLLPEGEKAERQLRDYLTRILAHELRHPLAAVLTRLHVLHRVGAHERAALQACDRAEQQAWYMTRVLEDLLAICRGRRRNLRLRKERVDLATVVDEAIDSARPFLTQRRHHLTVSLPPQPVSLVADISRLTQILTSLLTTAGRQTEPSGDISLSVEVADGVVVLRVHDNGLGIAPDILPRIFELLSQEDRPGSQACPELGIGLALVKVLVELHGGTIEAYRQGPGTGSELVVRLPRCAPVLGEDPALEVMSRPERPADDSGSDLEQACKVL